VRLGKMLIEELKDYVVLRVDEKAGWSRELYGESDLEGEAIRFAGMLASFEAKEGVSFEVRTSCGYALVYSTAEEDPLAVEGVA
jgi:hypothetical protein